MDTKQVQLNNPATEALALIQQSGILNPKMPLEDIMNLTQRVAQLHAARAAVAPGDGSSNEVNTFIHQHFIYRYES